MSEYRHTPAQYDILMVVISSLFCILGFWFGSAVGMVWGHNKAKQEFKLEAVKNGVAKWTVDETGIPKLEWKKDE
jgi:hypothetical protein